MVLLKHSQTRYITNADKAEATDNTYMHTKTNRNTHRHKRDRNTCKDRNIKIKHLYKIYIKQIQYK